MTNCGIIAIMNTHIEVDAYLSEMKAHRDDTRVRIEISLAHLSGLLCKLAIASGKIDSDWEIDLVPSNAITIDEDDGTGKSPIVRLTLPLNPPDASS